MRTAFLVALAACGLFCGLARAEFQMQDDGAALNISENGQPVLVYHYVMVQPPAGVEARFTRSGYIHPLYGLDGEVMTEDFPVDHRHHRGIFWAWPECTAADKHMNVWEMTGVRQRHGEWVTKTAEKDKAVVAAVNIWSFDDAPEKAVVREEVRFTVLPADKSSRAIDFALKFTNVSAAPVTFLGAKNKGYGGFCFRPDAARKPFTFTAADGAHAEDALRCDTGWADITFANGKGGESGVAILQHASNPGYPFPGWIFRHYGFLGASWPHEQSFLLAPGQAFELRYRLLIHRGNAKDARIEKEAADYAQAKEAADK